jgi:hypothetical protein
LGQTFKIKNDYQSLKFLLEQKIGTPTEEKWITKLLEYDFTIEYKMGKDNVGADDLSRKMEEVVVPLQEGQLILITFPNPTWVENIKDNYLQDSVLHQLILDLENGNYLHPKNSFRSGLLLYKGRLSVSPLESLRTRILHLVPDSPAAGH